MSATAATREARPVLDGLRVLDFGRYVAGPYCATLLGYFGAEVIRVERPGGGEDRGIAPVTAQGDGATWLQMGVNKRSLTLDLGAVAGREVLARLVPTADVAVVNLPPASAARLGLDEATLRGLRPDIIVAAVTAFGAEGPWRNRGGFDGVGQAMSGAMAFSGRPGAPAKAAAPYVDFGTGILAAFGVLAALMERARSGEGQRVDASLLSTALTFFNAFLVEEGLTGRDRQGSGNRVQTSGPSDVFATRDGHVLIHVVGDGLFRRCARLVGEPGWLDDPRFASDAMRGENGAVLCERLATWCAERTTEEALAAFDRAGVPAGPVLSARDALAHPQVRGEAVLGAHALSGATRPAPIAGPPVRLSRNPGTVRSLAPGVGAHADAILAELGYDREAIDALRRERVI